MAAKINLSDAERENVLNDRDSHPASHIRRKMLALWASHLGYSRDQVAELAGISRATVQRYLAAYRRGGLDGLREWNVLGSVSALIDFKDAIKASLIEDPVRSAVGVAERIRLITGLKCSRSRARTWLKSNGFHHKRKRSRLFDDLRPGQTVRIVRVWAPCRRFSSKNEAETVSGFDLLASAITAPELITDSSGQP